MYEQISPYLTIYKYTYDVSIYLGLESISCTMSNYLSTYLKG